MAGGPADQVRARLDIVEVISEKVQLKKAGKTLKGLCPFHTEKTPSFIVFPESQRWHCFGCGAGGDVFGFVMQSQNLGFGEALTLLAARAGVELRRERRDPKVEDAEDRLVAINEAAATYFRSMLSGPAGTRARSYAEGRDVSAESIATFELGYAPDGGASLAHHLIQQGFKREDVLLAGVAGENDSGGLYDRFRNRLIFPIRDIGGRLIGFGGRALSSETQPKYLNTPQTPLFDKGGSLYLLNLAKQEIRRTGQAVIVEGYMDALMAHQHGFRNVVASLGTALTDRQVSLVKRYATELLFALDPDVAGQEATARGLEVAMGALDREATPVPTWKGFIDFSYKLKTNIRIISLPKGNDPDDLIKHRPDEWQRVVREAAPVQDFFLARVKSRHDLSTAAGKMAAAEEAMGVIAEIPEPIQQAHYVQRLASMVGVDESILLQQVRRRKGRPRGFGTPGVRRSTEPAADMESYCLALVLTQPGLLNGEPKLREQDFQDPALRELFKSVLARAWRGYSSEELVELLKNEVDEPLREAIESLLELKNRQPVQFEDPLEKAYKEAVVTLQLGSLALRRQQLEALQSEDGDPQPEDGADMAQLQKQIAEEAHRLKLLGGILPLRAIHKEVRHGG